MKFTVEDILTLEKYEDISEMCEDIRSKDNMIEQLTDEREEYKKLMKEVRDEAVPTDGSKLGE